MAPHQLVLDGRPSFGQLQHRMLAKQADIAWVAATIPVSSVIFDLLWINGVT